MPSSKSSMKLKRRKRLPRPAKIQEPKLPKATPEKPFKASKKKKKTQLELKTESIRLKGLKLQNKPSAKNQNKTTRTRKPKQPKQMRQTGTRTMVDKERLGRLSSTKAFYNRIAKGYPAELAGHIYPVFQRYKTEWDEALSDEERLMILKRASANRQAQYTVQIKKRGGVAQTDTGTFKTETEEHLRFRQFQLYEYYMLHPEAAAWRTDKTELPQTVEQITRKVEDDTTMAEELIKEQTEVTEELAKEQDKAYTKNDLVKSSDSEYYTKDHKFRFILKGTRWKAFTKNAKKNIWVHIFSGSTLEEVLEKINTKF